MDNDLRWDQVRYFVAVARAGSVVGAARRLGVSHATVLRNIVRLEERLGIRLFDHVRSGYRITAEGEEVFASALAMEEHAEALLRRAMGKDPNPQGLLKLVVADGTLFDPMPLLRRFRAAQPRIELTLEDARTAADTRIAQLHADVAILATNSPPDELVGRQLSRVRFAAFAAPEYLNPTSPAPSAQSLRWILWTLGDSAELDDGWQRAALRRLVRRPDVVLHTDRHSEALAAVRAGLGAAFLSAASGAGLVRLPFPEPQETVGIWLLTHPDLRRSGRVRAFFDFVAEHVHGTVGAIS